VWFVQGDTEVAGKWQEECRRARVGIDLYYVRGVLEIEGTVLTWWLMSSHCSRSAWT
jgi:hypothetical protein